MLSAESLRTRISIFFLQPSGVTSPLIADLAAPSYRGLEGAFSRSLQTSWRSPPRTVMGKLKKAKKGSAETKQAAKAAKKAKGAEKAASKGIKTVKKSKGKAAKDAGDMDEDDLIRTLAEYRAQWIADHATTEEVLSGPPSRRANATLTACPVKDHLYLFGGEVSSPSPIGKLQLTPLVFQKYYDGQTV